MAARKQGLSLNQHRSIGLTLAMIQDQLTTYEVAVGNAYPEKILNKLAKVGNALRAFRETMEDIVCTENPQLPHPANLHVYQPTHEQRDSSDIRLKVSVPARE